MNKISIKKVYWRDQWDRACDRAIERDNFKERHNQHRRKVYSMTPKEFAALTNGTADPLTPEQLMLRALQRLDGLLAMKRTHDVNTRIDEICYILSIAVQPDGTIQPTHYYG